MTPDPVQPDPAPHDAAPGDRSAGTTFRPDPLAYWRAHLVMAVLGGTVAGGALVALGNPHAWTGPVAALLAIAVRAAYLRPEALAEVWHLRDDALSGPGGRRVALSALAEVRPVFGSLVLVTRGGDKHQMKYLADPATARARILAARDALPATGAGR